MVTWPWGRDRSQSPPCWIKQIHLSTASQRTTRLLWTIHTALLHTANSVLYMHLPYNKAWLLCDFEKPSHAVGKMSIWGECQNWSVKRGRAAFDHSHSFITFQQTRGFELNWFIIPASWQCLLADNIQANTRHWTDVDLMLAQSRRRWVIISPLTWNPGLDERITNTVSGHRFQATNFTTVYFFQMYSAKMYLTPILLKLNGWNIWKYLLTLKVSRYCLFILAEQYTAITSSSSTCSIII